MWFVDVAFVGSTELVITSGFTSLRIEGSKARVQHVEHMSRAGYRWTRALFHFLCRLCTKPVWYHVERRNIVFLAIIMGMTTIVCHSPQFDLFAPHIILNLFLTTPSKPNLRAPHQPTFHFNNGLRTLQTRSKEVPSSLPYNLWWTPCAITTANTCQEQQR